MTDTKEKKFKVLLIHANTSMDTLIPPAIATISACLKIAGNDVKLFDTTFYNYKKGLTGDQSRARTLQVKETNFEEFGIHTNKTDMVEDFLKMVEEYKPDLIGVSILEVTFNMSMDLINAVKKIKPDITVAIGGSFAMTAPELAIKEKNIDIVCIGEAENAFVEMCEKLKNKEDHTRILNLWVKKDGKIFKNKLGNLIDINDLPYQDWEIFNQNRIYKPMSGKISRTGCFELTRGCIYSCTFCINEYFNKIHNNKSYREKSISKYIDEVKYFKDKYNLEYIYMFLQKCSFQLQSKG